MARHRGLRNRDHGPLARAGIIFGDDNDQAGHDEADEAADEEMQPVHGHVVRRADVAEADGEIGRDRKARDRQDAGRDETLIERAHDRIGRAELDEICAGDRGHDAGRADRQRIEHRRGEHRLTGEEDRGEHHGRDHGHRIGLEKIGRHAGAIADIVADIVGDGRGIARIVFRDSRFDLADEIGADIRAFGENAAAETGEDRNQRGAETERDKRINRFAAVGIMMQRAGENEIIGSDANQSEAGDEHARDRARLEGNVEARGQGLGRGLRRADIGANRHIHADEAGGARQNRADQKADGDRPGQQQAENDEDDRADAGNGHILSFEIGLRPFRDRPRDFLHPRRARIRGEKLRCGDRAVTDGEKSAENHHPKRNHRDSALPFLAAILRRLNYCRSIRWLEEDLQISSHRLAEFRAHLMQKAAAFAIRAAPSVRLSARLPTQKC